MGGNAMKFRYRRRLGNLRGGRILFILGLILALGIFLFIVIDRNTSPVIINMAEARVRAMAVKAMNDAVRSIMTDPVKYTDLIKVVQDNEGRVMMIQADTLKMNEISASAALTTQDNLGKIGDQGIGIPLGSVLGGQLLSGRGPNIYARIIPVGSVTTDFESEFQDEGINQTRHKIFLNLHTSVRIVIPTQSREVSVDTKVLVTECIIVGQVPSYYANVSDPNELNIIPRITAAPK
jgi:sporulation protein YunB